MANAMCLDSRAVVRSKVLASAALQVPVKARSRALSIAPKGMFFRLSPNSRLACLASPALQDGGHARPVEGLFHEWQHRVNHGQAFTGLEVADVALVQHAMLLA